MEQTTVLGMFNNSRICNMFACEGIIIAYEVCSLSCSMGIVVAVVMVSTQVCCGEWG